jgi:hypothetical protein
MAHFAKVENGTVTQVIVADQEFIDSGAVGLGWIQTSYNTHGGVHYGPDGKPDGGIALRKNFAGIGYTFNPEMDAFYEPQPYPSWLLNPQTCYWYAPVPLPPDSDVVYYEWDEATVSWVPLTQGN